MSEDEPHKPSERLTEELQRQDWRERMADLERNLEFYRRKTEDEELAELERQYREGTQEPIPHSLFASVTYAPITGAMIHPGSIPLYLRLSPEEQTEFDKASADYHSQL